MQAPRPENAEASPEFRGKLLWLKIGLAQELLNTAAQRFWTSPELARVFPCFLRELYSMVSCSVPLMRAAVERARELGEGDALAVKTAAYLEQHIVEEAHHDEWLLDDLAASGMDRAELLRRPPGANVAQLIGAQYCWIGHAHPAAVFGYLAVIEGNPPLEEHLNEIAAQTGYSPETFRCLRQHAADDVEHLKDLHATITQLPLRAEDETLIAMSALATVDGLVRLFEEMITKAGGAN